MQLLDVVDVADVAGLAGGSAWCGPVGRRSAVPRTRPSRGHDGGVWQGCRHSCPCDDVVEATLDSPAAGASAVPAEVNEAARAVAEQVIDGRVLQDAVMGALDSDAIQTAIQRALESGAVSRAVERALDDGGALQEAVKRATDSTVRDAVERAMDAHQRSGR
jgi:hypothetical protein